MFQIGDKVVYPMHGAGVIESIEEKEFLGEMQRYYIIKITSNNLKIMIPTNKISTSDLRLINDESTLKNVLLTLNDGETNKDEMAPAKERNLIFTEKIKSGSLRKNAEVVRDLMFINDIKPLNTTEKQLLDKAKKLLVSEIALIKDITNIQADDLLMKIIN
ncbi:transcriptional regulator, CarD family [Clostridium amylolyticum]|uniref:Transcriptional regulator, CarD family n=1 Tax=Clostridium amylolyticum TaxID=1121298 RepID=A0A1M6FAM0_9CLOT|nr:transcriptional regulator, CarD family [Clostridium amylolyticum]